MLARDEKFGSIMREPSTHMREGSKQSSWDAYNSSRGTNDLEGA